MIPLLRRRLLVGRPSKPYFVKGDDEPVRLTVACDFLSAVMAYAYYHEFAYSDVRKRN